MEFSRIVLYLSILIVQWIVVSIAVSIKFFGKEQFSINGSIHRYQFSRTILFLNDKFT